jgi:hypothetical protein
MKSGNTFFGISERTTTNSIHKRTLAKDCPVKDLKEFYHLYSANDLPGMIDGKPTMLVRQQLFSLATTLLRWIQEQSPFYIQQGYLEPLPEMIQGSEQTLLRILHYPPLDGDVEEGAVRAAPHEDINLITLLPAATQPGLEVASVTGYIPVDCDPGNIIVNVGDMLQLASQGFFKSTTHRVVNPSGEEAKKSRYSMPLFLHPRPEVQLSRNKTAGQYLEERLKELGLK